MRDGVRFGATDRRGARWEPTWQPSDPPDLIGRYSPAILPERLPRFQPDLSNTPRMRRIRARAFSAGSATPGAKQLGPPMTRYFLEVQDSVKPATPLEWVQWYENSDDDCVIGVETVGDAEVSTVFIGIDCGLDPEPPRPYETKVFGGPCDQRRWHYSTRDEAEAGHLAAIAFVRESADTQNAEARPGILTRMLRRIHGPSPVRVAGAGSR